MLPPEIPRHAGQYFPVAPFVCKSILLLKNTEGIKLYVTA